jgi:hypothetical protein
MRQHRHSHLPGAPEAGNAGAGQGPVLIDVGEGAGALVLHAPASMNGAEIEISPVGQDGRRTHVAVLARPVGHRVLHAAVYPSLTAGPWQLWHPDGTITLTVHIVAGQVTEVRWPETD